MRELIQTLDAFFSLLILPVYYAYYPLVLISLAYIGRKNWKKEFAPKFVLRGLFFSIIYCSVTYCALTALLLYQRAGYALLGSVYLSPAFLLGLFDLFLIRKCAVRTRSNDVELSKEEIN